MAAKTASRTVGKPTPKTLTKSADADPDIRNERIPAGLLSVDHRVQRDHLNRSKLNRIRDNYNRAALHALVVSERPDGSYVIIDGQHRWTIALELEGDSFEMRCEVHSGLSLQDEAKLFIDLNNQESASPLDLHKARVTQGEPVAVALDLAASEHEWAIGTGAGKISAVKVLENLYLNGENWYDGYGPVLVSRTLGVITQAWGHEQPQVMNKSIIQSVGEFILAVEIWVSETGKPSDYFDYEGLAFAMQTKLKNGPRGWIIAQRGIAEGSEFTLVQAMRQSLFRIYNMVARTRRRGRLPDLLRGAATTR